MAWNHYVKWVELIKEIVPNVTRAAVLRDTRGSGASQFAVIQAVAPSLGMEVQPVNVGSASEIERGVAAFARAPHGGLIVLAQPTTFVHHGFKSNCDPPSRWNGSWQ